MNLIHNWQQAYKSLAVILPTVGAGAIAANAFLQQTYDAGVVPIQYQPYLLIIIPFLSWVGRTINQGGITNDKVNVQAFISAPSNSKLSNKGVTFLTARLKPRPGLSVFNNCDLIISACCAFGITDIRQIAYVLATAWHETAGTMEPIEEYGKGKGKKYGTFTDIDGTKYENLPFLYYGRGFVQLTWLTNYIKARKILGIDFVNKPQLALDPNNAAKIIVIGMRDGWFTGKRLSSYITNTSCNYLNARRIINGTDKAQLIADYATLFERSLKM